MEKGTTVRVVVGYQLQCAVLENGWPQTGRSISGALGQAKAREKGVGKGEAIRASDYTFPPRTRQRPQRIRTCVRTMEFPPSLESTYASKGYVKL
eukprot:347082-Pyramimonas_sp.AAC.1